VQEGARNREALAHAAGEFTDRAFSDVRQVDALEPLARGGGGLREAEEIGEVAEILEGGEFFVDADTVAEQADARAGFAIADGFAQQAHVTLDG
jgi:hypothetical protein